MAENEKDRHILADLARQLEVWSKNPEDVRKLEVGDLGPMMREYMESVRVTIAGTRELQESVVRYEANLRLKQGDLERVTALIENSESDLGALKDKLEERDEELETARSRTLLFQVLFETVVVRWASKIIGDERSQLLEILATTGYKVNPEDNELLLEVLAQGLVRAAGARVLLKPKDTGKQG